jgi:hypothetical protein
MDFDLTISPELINLLEWAIHNAEKELSAIFQAAITANDKQKEHSPEESSVEEEIDKIIRFHAVISKIIKIAESKLYKVEQNLFLNKELASAEEKLSLSGKFDKNSVKAAVKNILLHNLKSKDQSTKNQIKEFYIQVLENWEDSACDAKA